MPVASGQVRLDDLLGVCSSEQGLNAALLKEMLHLFVHENRRRVRNVVAAADAGDEECLRSEVHAVKGSAALIGADCLRELASEFEARLVSGTTRDIQSSARELTEEYTAVVATLRSLYPDLGVS